MLSDSQKLTDGLIIYSALISDFEKLDFKNDALAGVRANYFNSNKQMQYDKSEISLEEKTYNISYRMGEDEPLSWKVTRNNQPFQSVKKTTGGVYSVIFYRENGIIYKRAFYDKAHNWLRTEYYDSNYENVKIAVLAPKIISGITALLFERINVDGEHNYSVLYPSESVPMKKCTGLIYSNVGMLWYDETFRPEDLPVENLPLNDSKNSGFKFNNSDEIFELSQKADSLNLSDAEYLVETTCNCDESENTSEKKTDKKENEQSYSAYDKIANILSEAHKTNKDLFGEIISQTSSDFYEQEDISDKAEDSEESVEEVLSEDNISAESEENIQTDSANSESNFVAEEVHEEYDTKENPDCNVIIHTKSGRYAYFGDVDENNNRTGRGRTVTPQGLTSYDGEYLDDRRNGFGVCYYKEGNINYVGNWVNGKREGSGVGYRLSDGTMHAGKWSDNSPDGCGARFDSDGNFIDVCFYNGGKRNGKSVSFDENGRVLIKNWVDGELVSEFTVDEEA